MGLENYTVKVLAPIHNYCKAMADRFEKDEDIRPRAAAIAYRDLEERLATLMKELLEDVQKPPTK